MMGSPKINLLYYKHILDESMERFANDFSGGFVRSSSGYVFPSNAERKIFRAFSGYVEDGILRHTREFDIRSPNYFFIISSCYPKDNILGKYVPEEDRNAEMGGTVKYFLSEDDISMDGRMFNSVFERICDGLVDRKRMRRRFGDRARNVFVMRYDRLDCYFAYRMIRDIYGKTNTVNLFKNGNGGIRSHLRSVNEEIDSKVRNIKGIIRSDEMRCMKMEIRDYMEECMRGDV